MAKQSQQNLIDSVASSLQEWLRSKDGNSIPTAKEISSALAKNLKDAGLALVSDEEWVGESQKLPALLKSPESLKQSRRMRELAGISHKDNFV